jgi:hypothetical protein
MKKFAVAAFLSCLAAGGAQAMTYNLLPLRDGSAAVVARGRIEGQEAGRLLSVVAQAQAQGVMPRTLIISSPGGNLASALELGQALRELGMRTTVGAMAQDAAGGLAVTGGGCHSACVMVLMAGVGRSVLPGSKVGVHSPQTHVTLRGQRYVLDEETSRRLAEPALRSYARYMGVSPALIDVAHRVPHTSIRTLTASEMNRFGLVTSRSGRRTAQGNLRGRSRSRA